jgi:hypothetical protein
MKAEQRKSRRRAIAYPMRLRDPIGKKEWPCRMLDVSRDGARIALERAAELPDQFLVMVAPGAAPRKAERVWRTNTEIGVRFLKPE